MDFKLVNTGIFLESSDISIDTNIFSQLGRIILSFFVYIVHGGK